MNKDVKEYGKWEELASREFDGGIIITDPCYYMHGNVAKDWDWLKSWISDRGLFSRTFYGDWGCSVFRVSGDVGCIPDDADKIGEFCADAGLVSVLDLRDAKHLFPDVEKWVEEHGWCATIIRGFRGKVRLMTYTEEMRIDDGTTYDNTELRVRGDGTADGEAISFESMQTSL